MAEKKRTYRKGMELIHKESKEKILFGKWNDDGSAACLSSTKKTFLTISKEDLDTQYISYAPLS